MVNKFSMISTLVLSTIFIMPANASKQNYDTNSKTKYGITVTQCTADYETEKFCSDKNMKAFAKALETKPINFANDLILYSFKSSDRVMSYKNSSYRLVAIDKKNKKVIPFWWGFNPADKPVNSKGEHLEYIFNKNSNSLCVKGNVEAYRNAYEYDGKNPFCFTYINNDFEEDTNKGFYKPNRE